MYTLNRSEVACRKEMLARAKRHEAYSQDNIARDIAGLVLLVIFSTLATLFVYLIA